MKKIMSFILVMILLMGTLSVSAMSVSEMFDPENEYKYEEIVIPQFFQQYEWEDHYFEISYRESYEYYCPDNIVTDDEATPDYVLIQLKSNAVEPMPIAYVNGGYVLWSYGVSSPFEYGYGVYLPESGDVYDLVDVLDMNIEGISNVFTEVGIGTLIGDMDEDRVITIKDATFIQKAIVGIENFDVNDKIDAFEAELRQNEIPPLLYISDFNRDCERNIKDATAIQKHVAGLEY